MATRGVVALDKEDYHVNQLKRHLDGLVSICERHRKVLADSKPNCFTHDIDDRLSYSHDPTAEGFITERISNNLKLDHRAATKITALMSVYYFS